MLEKVILGFFPWISGSSSVLVLQENFHLNSISFLILKACKHIKLCACLLFCFHIVVVELLAKRMEILRITCSFSFDRTTGDSYNCFLSYAFFFVFPNHLWNKKWSMRVLNSCFTGLPVIFLTITLMGLYQVNGLHCSWNRCKQLSSSYLSSF